MQLVQKLTAATLGWDRNKIGMATKDGADGGRTLLGRVVGMVSGYKESLNADTGEVQRGLKGNFRGVNGDVQVTSGVCYLPSGIQAMIEGALDEAKAKDKSAVVNFAIDLYALRATNKAGYTFDAENLVAGEVSDPLDDLLNKAAAIKALPAPDAPAAEPAAEPAKETAKK